MRLLIFPICSLFFVACSHSPANKQDSKILQGDFTTRPGWVSVFQTATSKDQTTINILRPHLAKLAYVVKGLGEQKVIQTIGAPPVHWKVDRIHVKGLKPGKTYQLQIVKKRSRTPIDWRDFKTLDLDKKEARFVVGSCMSDSHAFEHVRNTIWQKISNEKPDFVMLLGDQVYVDDFDFVAREKATEFDIWTRYVDSFRKIPFFHMRKLIPILSVWDDHDFGTNNSNKNFKSKKAAEKIYRAIFGGENIPGVYEYSKKGVFSSFDGFGQRFLLMDDRFYREPSKKAPFGHWGLKQHKWFREKLMKSKKPVWLANGNQFFAEATHKKQRNGTIKQLNESFVADHPTHFTELAKDIKSAKAPVAFLSGDVHFSEITAVEKKLFGYPTYEITSSPLHSYIFRTKVGEKKFLNNSRRMLAVKDHNYVLVQSVKTQKGLDIRAQSFGVKKEAPLFDKKLRVVK